MLIVVGLAGAGIAAAYVSPRAAGERSAAATPSSPILADVVAETLDDLRAERDPRRAVIAAYARLERALAALRPAAAPAEAPEEYLARILGELEVGSRRCQRLTALFERAKFSQHEVDAEMKDEAIDTLEAAARGAARGARAAPPQERARALAEARERAARREARRRPRRRGRSSLPTSALVVVLVLVPGPARRSPSHVYAARRSPRSRSLAVRRARSRAYPPPRARRRSTRRCDRPAETDERLPELARLEREVTLGTVERLRPPLPAAAGRCARSPRGLLAVRRGVELDREPEPARAALGDETWELVRAGPRAAAPTASAAGSSSTTLRRVVAALEAL